MYATKRIIFLLLCLSALFACSRIEMPAECERLYICAASVPFSQNGEDAGVESKSINNGYLTTFEPGDAIGVTGVDADGNVIDICNNIRFVFQRDTVIGGAIWSYFLNDRGFPFVEKVNGAVYFAYYPYDSRWNGCTLDYICENFTVQEDQSSKEAFTLSDLMAPDEAIAPSNGLLRFVLKHKMATVSLFYNNEWMPDGVTPLYPIHLLSGTFPETFKLDNTYRSQITPTWTELRRRYLVNPRTTPSVKIVGCLEEKNIRLFSHSIDVEEGKLYSVSFEGAPMVPYTDGVDLELNDVEFEDRNGNIITLGHTVYWSKYNLGESVDEKYPYEPYAGDRGARSGSRDPYARGDYYSWGATFTQYDNGLTGYKGYGFNNYFDNKYNIAPLGGTIKETEYDVAHAKWWRGKWRLPTENEFRAMYAGCTFEKVSTYSETQQRYMGSPGTKRIFNVIKVTSKKNPEKFIYFSTGGYLDGTMEPEFNEDGTYTDSGDGKKNNGILYPQVAYYMSSSASPTILRCVSYAYFNQDSQLIKVDGSRYTGMLVRPVYCPDEE